MEIGPIVGVVDGVVGMAGFVGKFIDGGVVVGVVGVCITGAVEVPEAGVDDGVIVAGVVV